MPMTWLTIIPDSFLWFTAGCLSAGCYAITDEAIQELYILAREAFAQGQKEFPIHAFPFRMTDEAMAFRKGHKWEPFWQNLREGYKVFEETKKPPIVGVKNKRYVFFADGAAVPDAFKTASARTSWPRASSRAYRTNASGQMRCSNASTTS